MDSSLKFSESALEKAKLKLSEKQRELQETIQKLNYVKERHQEFLNEKRYLTKVVKNSKNSSNKLQPSENDKFKNIVKIFYPRET